MGRNRGPRKFSFPLPRISRNKAGDDNHGPHSTPSIPSAPEWPAQHCDDPSSKAHRVLGTSEPLYRSISGQTSKTSIPASPGYMSITVSEASSASHPDDRTTGKAADNTRSIPPVMSKRPSSNILGRTYTADGARSDNSSLSHRLQPQSSSSTMRSHYDAKSSPLSISQQTSDSAVRDRALRRGQPSVLAADHGYQGHVASPISPGCLDDPGKASRKSKPARLDLTKLFPKPKAGQNQDYGNALLSPTKMVNSPAALSMVSDYFPRPMTREPTPQIGGPIKLKTTSQHQNPTMRSPQPPYSPVRKFKKDEYDNAKIHVRRPPKGVQHWFDALDEDSDEASVDARVPIHAPKAIRANMMPQIPIRTGSLERLSYHGTSPRREPWANKPHRVSRHDTFAHEDIVNVGRPTSRSEFSAKTQNSIYSNRTKESSISRTNLQDSSILSFSSSEDESDNVRSKANNFAVRKSLEIATDAGDIVIGQAQAFEVGQHRRPSVGVMSTRTASTNAATIEVMYTPEPTFPPYHHPYHHHHHHHHSRRSDHSGSKLAAHVRQPSIILEDEDFRPQTAFNAPRSPSTHSVISARTSASEPQPRVNGSRKMMAVTAEEEALLELMRKRRAAMAKMSPSHVESSDNEKEERQKPPRTSAFLLMEASPVPLADAKGAGRASALPPSPIVLPSRGRRITTEHDENFAANRLRDSSASDSWSDRHGSPVTRGRLPHYLPTPAEFSPLEPFPPSSPTPTASVISPATTDHASPLPSPMTPRLRFGDKDVNVKVASSDTSNELDDIVVLDNGIIGGVSESTKSASSYDNASPHQRRRTASSGADASFSIPHSSVIRELAPVSETSSRSPSMVEPPLPKLSKRSSQLVSASGLTATAPSRSRQSSVHSVASRSSSYSQSSSLHNGLDKRIGRRVSRGNSEASRPNTRDKRSSVSEDVLAAWNSLGGTY
ncbi:hypothetical protein ACN47E_002117 [Coniothyrium glycines]